MGKCFSKNCSQFYVSHTGCSTDGKQAALDESPVRGVMNPESMAFLREYAFSMTNAAYAGFESPATAAVQGADDGLQSSSGCFHLPPNTKRASEGRIAGNPVQFFEESRKLEGPVESALMKCSSQKQFLACSPNKIKLLLAPSCAKSASTKWPSVMAASANSPCPLLFPTASTTNFQILQPLQNSRIDQDLQQASDLPSNGSGTVKMMLPVISSIEQEKDCSDLLLECCRICKKSSCNCCHLAPIFLVPLNDISELAINALSEVSAEPKVGADDGAPDHLHHCILKQIPTDPKAEGPKNIRQSESLAITDLF